MTSVNGVMFASSRQSIITNLSWHLLQNSQSSFAYKQENAN